MDDLDYSALPWTHPSVFLNILEHCDGRSVLACRLVCSAWRNWLSRTPVWSRLYRKRMAYYYLLFKQQNDAASSNSALKLAKMFQCRVKKLLELSIDEVDEGSLMRLVLRLERCEHQLLKQLMPRISQETMHYISSLEKMNMESKHPVKFLGPINLFIRLKVDHPALLDMICELLNRYLTSVLVNRKDQQDNPRLKCLIFKSMSTGQNWTSHYFDPLDAAEEGPSAVVEDLHKSKGGRDAQKRKMETEEEDEDRRVEAKQARLEGHSEDDQEDARNADEEKEEEEDEVESSGSYDSLYTAKEAPSLAFPTVLDLLDIDHPVIESLLINRLALNKSVVVPKIEEFIIHQERHQDLVNGVWEIVGRDDEGNVSKVDPKQFRTTESALIGNYVELPYSYGVKGEQLLQFWGGRDIRDRWPAFARQLAELDQAVEKAGGQLNLPVVSSQPPIRATFVNPRSSGDEDAASQQQDAQVRVDENLVAMLAARGIFVTPLQ